MTGYFYEKVFHNDSKGNETCAVEIRNSSYPCHANPETPSLLTKKNQSALSVTPNLILPVDFSLKSLAFCHDGMRECINGKTIHYPLTIIH